MTESREVDAVLPPAQVAYTHRRARLQQVKSSNGSHVASSSVRAERELVVAAALGLRVASRLQVARLAKRSVCVTQVFRYRHTHAAISHGESSSTSPAGRQRRRQDRNAAAVMPA